MCQKEKKLEVGKKIKESFQELLKRLNLSMLTRLFSVVVLDFDKIFDRLCSWFDDNGIDNATLFLSCIVLYSVSVLLFVILWTFVLLLG